jgi:hypothetical protein
LIYVGSAEDNRVYPRRRSTNFWSKAKEGKTVPASGDPFVWARGRRAEALANADVGFEIIQDQFRHRSTGLCWHPCDPPRLQLFGNLLRDMKTVRQSVLPR